MKSGVLWRDSTRDQLMRNEWECPPMQVAVPGAVMRESSSVSDLGQWYAIGDAWAQLAMKYLPAGPAHVVDIGCGCGKLARLLAYNPVVTYHGLDVFNPAIEWCVWAFRENKKFQFTHLDVQSSVYNPTGRISASTVTLPIDDQAADLVIAASLFTHLLDDAFNRYLSEIARILAPKGYALVSVRFGETSSIKGDEADIRIDRTYFEMLLKAHDLAMRDLLPDIFGQSIAVLGSPSR